MLTQQVNQYKSDPSMKEALDNLLSSTSLWSAVKSYLQSIDQSKILVKLSVIPLNNLQ